MAQPLADTVPTWRLPALSTPAPPWQQQTAAACRRFHSPAHSHGLFHRGGFSLQEMEQHLTGGCGWIRLAAWLLPVI